MDCIIDLLNDDGRNRTLYLLISVDYRILPFVGCPCVDFAYICARLFTNDLLLILRMLDLDFV